MKAASPIALFHRVGNAGNPVIGLPVAVGISPDAVSGTTSVNVPPMATSRRACVSVKFILLIEMTAVQMQHWRPG